MNKGLLKKPSGEDGEEDDAAQVQTTKGGRKSPTEIKIEKLKYTFSQNFAGMKKNGRPQIETKYNRLAISNVTTPIRKSPLRESETLDQS